MPSLPDSKGVRTQAEFNECYDASPNPYETALRLFMQGVNYQEAKAKSFTYFTLEALGKYMAIHPERHVLLEDPLKLVAFNMTNKDPNSSLFKTVASCFRFPESAPIFEGHVRNLMLQHNYVNAARFAQHCGVVHPDFVHGFLVPLTFSRHQVSVVYDYLEVGTSLQEPLLSTLDSMMTSQARNNIMFMLQTYNYREIPEENLTYDYLRKNIPKLRKKFKVPLEATPNAHKQQNLGALEFWIKRRLTCEADPTVFEDNIKALVAQDNVEGQVMLITKLLQHKLGLECVKWMRFFNMDMNDLPVDIRRKIQEAERNQKMMGSRLDGPRVHNPYTLDFKRVELSFVSNPTSFANMLKVLAAAPMGLISFDMEWKPTYNESGEIALMQFATLSHVFVVDKQSPDLSGEWWRNLGAALNRPELLILGFGCTEDLTKLAKDTEMGLSRTTLNRIVDMFLVWNILDADYKNMLRPYHTQGRGLKDLVRAFLKKNLDKRMQMSDWTLRPLRPEQIRYAALDAYCLVDVYMVIKRGLEEKGADVNDVFDKYQRKYGKR